MGHRHKEIRFLESTVLTASYFVCYETLLQNAMTDVFTKRNSYFMIKCDSHFITKCDKNLLKNASGFFYKMQQLLQSATILL